MTLCRTLIGGYLVSVREDERHTRGDGGKQDNSGSHDVSALVVGNLPEESQMLLRTYVELATLCQAFISNETHPRAERNRLSEERELFRYEPDEYFSKNATYEGQIKTLTTQEAQVRIIASNADTASGK